MKTILALAFCLVAAVVAAQEDASSPSIATNQGTTADRTRLLARIFGDYNKKVNPDNVKLDFAVNLVDFSVNEKRNILDSYVWLRYQWYDERLKWDPQEFGGADLIRLDSNEIWKPDVTLYNSADPVNMINCWESNVLIYAEGKVLWVPPCKMSSNCNFTLKKEPYGEQKCIFKFGSWTFDGNIMDVNFYNNTAELDLSYFQNSSGFEIVSNSAQKNVKFYSCCKEPYPDITYNITLKRVPGEELFNRF